GDVVVDDSGEGTAVVVFRWRGGSGGFMVGVVFGGGSGRLAPPLRTQSQIDHMLPERDQQLVEAKAESKATWRELTEVLSVLRTNPQRAGLLSQVGSGSEMGLSSESGKGGSGEDGSDNEDDKGQ
nr:hypothetical protein [Tanacetum cinerariifolium]